MAATRRRKLNVAAGAAAFVTAALVALEYVYTSLWPNISQGPPAARASTLAAMPESQLLYPGSRVLLRHTSGVQRLPFGTAAYPMINTSAACAGTSTAVLDYYRKQLAQRGWQGPDFTDTHAPDHWTKGHYVFTLTFQDAGTATSTAPPGYATTYDTAITYSDNAGPKPSPASAHA